MVHDLPGERTAESIGLRRPSPPGFFAPQLGSPGGSEAPSDNLGGRTISTSRSAEEVALQADTVSIHGDQPKALIFAQGLRKALVEEGVEIRAL